MADDMKNHGIQDRRRWLVFALSGGLCWLSVWVLFAIGGKFPGVALEQFVWHDVALVYVLGMLPLAMVLIEAIARHAPRWLSPPMVACMAFVLYLAVCRADLWLPFEILPAGGEVARSGSAFLCDVVCVAVVRMLLKRRVRGQETSRAGGGPGSMVLVEMTLALAFAMIIPTTYAKARGHHFQSKLVDLQTQGQLEMARRLAMQLFSLDPDLVIQGKPIKLVFLDLKIEVQEIEQRVRLQLDANSPAAARIERARQLAVLGRTPDALSALQPIEIDDPEYITACNLRGTIYEMQSDWPASRRWYQRANDGLSAREELRDPAARLTAIKGIAYTHRKQRQLPEAENAYRRLLQVHPSAETHFLLAEFYRDTQQATHAYESARRARELDPLRFQQPADELIDDLLTNHFGCLAVARRIRREHQPIRSAAAGSLLRRP